jgi:hypothetical protein
MTEADDRRDTATELSQAWSVVVAAARVLVPGTLVASLFFYFGLRYTEDHFLQYGVDDAAFRFSTTDYAVRSLNVTVEPARLVATFVVAAVAAHVALAVVLRRVDRARPGSGARVARAIGVALVAAGVAGALAFWSPGRFDVAPVTGTGWWLVSVLAVMYGLYLGWGRPGSAAPPDRERERPPLAEALGPTERKVVGSVVLAMAVVLVAHGAFDLTRAYARDRAIHQALRNEARPWAFPLVRVYSDIDLGLDDQLDVEEVVLPGDDGAYRYRYGDLRLFLHHGDQLLLWPADRSPRAGMFILRETEGLRIEYTPELR